jgi:hypothetical protein
VQEAELLQSTKEKNSDCEGGFETRKHVRHMSREQRIVSFWRCLFDELGLARGQVARISNDEIREGGILGKKEWRR